MARLVVRQACIGVLALACGCSGGRSLQGTESASAVSPTAGSGKPTTAQPTPQGSGSPTTSPTPPSTPTSTPKGSGKPSKP